MLYFVGTPIGNLKDITYRACETLNSCDYILCEDTRTSSKLLNAYNINKPLMSYHKYNEKQQCSKIIEDLKNDKNICLISDAGMPCISDPGFVVLQEVIKNDLPYSVLPGASAGITAFILSGFEKPFTFVGFLPNKNVEAYNLLQELKNYKSTLIFYVSPHSLNEDIELLYKNLGDRKLAVCRELTKTFEECVFTTLKEGYSGVLKGEFVLVVEGCKNSSNLSDMSILEHLKYYINLGFSKNDAIKEVAKERKIKKNDVYTEALKIEE